MEYKIALIPGDGIGPEIVAEAKKVLDRVCEKYSHKFSYTEVLLGGASIDAHGGTPLMLQIIIIYYGPALVWGIKLPRFSAALLSFVINYACYFSEIFRGGIQGIPSGQYEAGQVLGMTKSQIFFKVTLLQVIKRVIPPMGNEFINLVKDTALARTIAVYEVLWAGEKFVKNPGIIWPLFYTAVFYLLFSGILTLLFGWIEKKMDYFK